jgi:hypothetical protein
MSRRRLSFTEKRHARRARLAMKWDQLDKLEPRTTMTEPISVLALSTGVMSLARLGIIQTDGGNSGLLTMARLAQQAQQGPTRITPAPAAPYSMAPIAIVAPDPAAAAGGGTASQDPTPSGTVPRAEPGDALNLSLSAASPAPQSTGISTPWHPAAPTAGGGAMQPRGGSGGPSPALAAATSPGRSGGSPRQSSPSTPASSSAGAASSALLSALGLGAGGSAAAPTSAPGVGRHRGGHCQPQQSGHKPERRHRHSATQASRPGRRQSGIRIGDTGF